MQLAELVAGNQLGTTFLLLRDRLYFGDEVFRQPRMIDAARNASRENLANPAHRLIVNRADEVEIFTNPQLFECIEVVVRILSRETCAPAAYLRPYNALQQPLKVAPSKVCHRVKKATHAPFQRVSLRHIMSNAVNEQVKIHVDARRSCLGLLRHQFPHFGDVAADDSHAVFHIARQQLRVIALHRKWIMQFTFRDDLQYPHLL